MKHLFEALKIAVLLLLSGLIAFFCSWTLVNVASADVVYIKPLAVERNAPDYTIPPAIDLAVISITPPPHETMLAEVSAYTSSVDETDDTPNINAAGTKPGPGSIACPSRYEFGTEIVIRDESYFCDDRMNPRYSGGDYFDIWMETKPEAFQWGRRQVEVKVIN